MTVTQYSKTKLIKKVCDENKALCKYNYFNTNHFNVTS